LRKAYTQSTRKRLIEGKKSPSFEKEENARERHVFFFPGGFAGRKGDVTILHGKKEGRSPQKRGRGEEKFLSPSFSK